MTGRTPPAARQLPLTLPHRAAMTRADFLVGAANARAIELVDGWPAWPAPVVLLAGPVIYAIARTVRRQRNSLDLGMAMRELPPE